MNKSAPVVFAVFVVAFGIVACGCRTTSGRNDLTFSTRDTIYRRSDATFSNVILFKPLPDIGEDTMVFRLAPLILTETQSAPAVVEIKTNPAPTFIVERSLMINGRPHRQFAYYWQSQPCRQLQGVRMTLDSNLFPVIWEILADDSGARIVFVSESLEAQEMRESGAPLPSRRFSCEGDVIGDPDTVVARVISDGMTAMGPIIYQRADSRNVETLICRCMPAQAARAVGQIYFKLEPISADQERGILKQGGSPRNSIEEWLGPGRLERRLRLPQNF